MRELSLNERGSGISCACERSERMGVQAEEDAQTKLGRGLVLVKHVLPFRARERREDTSDRPPLGDAQPGFGETRDTADDDDRNDENGGEQEPVPHRGWRDHGKLLVVLLR